MIINAIRYRASEVHAWQAFKLNSGTGRFRNYQAVVAGAEALAGFVTALDYLLTGKTPTTAFEAQAQLSDDGGNTWTVHRRPAFVRYMKNGQAVEYGQALVMIE